MEENIGICPEMTTRSSFPKHKGRLFNHLHETPLGYHISHIEATVEDRDEVWKSCQTKPAPDTTRREDGIDPRKFPRIQSVVVALERFAL